MSTERDTLMREMWAENNGPPEGSLTCKNCQSITTTVSCYTRWSRDVTDEQIEAFRRRKLDLESFETGNAEVRAKLASGAGLEKVSFPSGFASK